MAEASQQQNAVPVLALLYPANDDVDNLNEGPDANLAAGDQEDEIAEVSIDALQDEDMHTGAGLGIDADGNTMEHSASFAPGSPSARAHIESTIDPAVWRVECERVAGTSLSVSLCLCASVSLFLYLPYSH
jgi:hypothetical protein